MRIVPFAVLVLVAGLAGCEQTKKVFDQRPGGVPESAKASGGGRSVELVAPADGVYYVSANGKLVLTKSVAGGDRFDLSGVDDAALPANADVRVYFDASGAAARGPTTRAHP